MTTDGSDILVIGDILGPKTGMKLSVSRVISLTEEGVNVDISLKNVGTEDYAATELFENVPVLTCSSDCARSKKEKGAVITDEAGNALIGAYTGDSVHLTDSDGQGVVFEWGTDRTVHVDDAVWTLSDYHDHSEISRIRVPLPSTLAVGETASLSYWIRPVP